MWYNKTTKRIFFFFCSKPNQVFNFSEIRPFVISDESRDRWSKAPEARRLGADCLGEWNAL